MAAGFLARLRAGRRRLRFTREGRWFVGVTLAIGFGAINTQNNLLYLLLSLLVSLILLSGVLSEAVLRRLEILRTPPQSLFAGRRTPIEIRVRNPKRHPSYAVEVEDLIDGHVTLRRCFYLKVSAGREQATTYPFTFPRRGRYRFRGYEVRTKFPFGLFVKSRQVDAPLEVVVFPEPLPAAARAAGDPGPEAPSVRERAGTGSELRDPRRFVPGDDPRLIRWRLSARTGTLLVADRAADEARRIEVVIENRLRADPADAAATARDEARIEREISAAAQIVLEASRLPGASVRLTAAESSIGPFPGSRARALLTFLALLPLVRPAPDAAGSAATPPPRERRPPNAAAPEARA